MHFVQEGLGGESIWTALNRQVFLGDDRFVERMQRKLGDECKDIEISKIQTRKPAPTLEQLLERDPSQLNGDPLCLTDYETYLQSFSSKSRSTIRRKVKKFREHCGKGMRFVEYKTPAEIDTFFDLELPLSDKTYQENLLDVGLL